MSVTATDLLHIAKRLDELNNTLKHMTRLMELMILEDGPKSWDERKSILEHLNVIREESK